jgi:hypothetical protein
MKAAERVGIDTPEGSKHLDDAGDHFFQGYKAGSAESAASLGWFYVQQNNTSDGEIFFEEAVNLGFGTPAVFNNWGYCLIKLDDKPKCMLAVEKLEVAVRMAPRLQAAHHNLALARLRIAHIEDQEGDKSRIAGNNILRAMEHLDAAKKCGESSAELELDAACIYALASVLSERKSIPAGNPEELLEKALSCCEVAIKEFGLPPRNLELLLAFAPELNANPDFQHLLKTGSDSKAAKLGGRLTNIYPDVCSRLSEHRQSD